MLRPMASPPRNGPHRRRSYVGSVGARALALVCGVLLLVGCAGADAPAAGQDAPNPAQASESEPVSPEPVSPEAPSLDGDYAYGLDRDAIAEAITETYASSGGQARWEDEALVLSMDGSTEDALTAHRTCRVVTELVNEGDEVVIEFPDGRVECADVLAG